MIYRGEKVTPKYISFIFQSFIDSRLSHETSDLLHTEKRKDDVFKTFLNNKNKRADFMLNRMVFHRKKASVLEEAVSS